MPRVFSFLKKKIGFDLLGFFSFSLTWDPMGAKSSKRYSSLKSLLNPFNFFSEISSQWSWQKYCFGFLKFWVFDISGILFVFFNMGPHGSQNFKTLLLPQISFDSFQTFSEISSQWSSQKYCFGFLKFGVFDFSGIFFVFIKIGPNVRHNFKTLLLPQITFESFQPFPEFSSLLSSQKYCFEFLQFQVSDF